MDTSPYSDVWFLKKLFVHESGTNPHDDAGIEIRQFNPYSISNEGLSENNWDASSRCPNMSYDGGFGLGQHTNPIPYKQTLWDWKANVHYAYYLLAEETQTGEVATKYSVIKNRLEGWIEDIEDWEEDTGLEVNGHADFEHGGITWVHGISDIIEDVDGLEGHFDEVLEDGERSFMDGMLLKMYNGLGTLGDPHYDKHFYYLDRSGAIPEWRIDVDAHYGSSVNRYVESVAETDIPN